MNLIDYFNGRTTEINKRHQWLVSYIKNIESKSPKIADMLLICDNLANELTILSNEINYRLEIVIKRQDSYDEFRKSAIEAIKTLAIKVNELESVQTTVKNEQAKATEMRKTWDKYVRNKAKQIDADRKKNKLTLKKRSGSPGIA